jgi:hypothetical protein
MSLFRIFLRVFAYAIAEDGNFGPAATARKR